jgi:hypothetical protein
MKLSAVRIQRTLDQMEEQSAFQGAVTVPDNSPTKRTLNEVFGDHTFFLDSDGLHIVEPAEPASAAEPAGQIVKLASWKDENRNSLTPHRPEATGVVVVLGSDETEEDS